MTRSPLQADPAPDQMRHIVFVPFLPGGDCAVLAGAGGSLSLPAGGLGPDEHYLDCRIRVANAFGNEISGSPHAIVWIAMRLHTSMTSESGTSNQLLSVRQAAQLLLVHVSTIRRWIKQGKLPAYRAGEKGVRVRLGDLSALLTPLGEHGQDGLHAHEPETISLAPLTPEEVGQARRAIEEVSRLQAEVREQNGSPLLESSAELLNALREERTRHLTSP